MRRCYIAVYDFDDTVYNGNSIVDFWKHAIRSHPRTLFYTPYQIASAVLWKCGIIPTGKFKEAFFSFMRAIPPRHFQSCVRSFWKKNKKKIHAWVPAQIEKDRGRALVPLCISASPDFLLEDIAKNLGFHALICSELLKKGSRRINKMRTPNCKGPEKVRRLREWARRENLDVVVERVYSDSVEDLPLYDLAKEQYHVTGGVLTEGPPIP